MTRSDDDIEVCLAENAGDLLRYFVRRVQQAEDAGDLLAETMIVAWRRSGRLPADEEGRRRWLFGIARNVLANAERSMRRRYRLASRVRALLRESETPPADAGGEVRDAIARLDPDLAEIVRLVHWEGFSLTEAAEIVGIPASTARGRYQRAKENLREALGVAAKP